MRLKKPHWSSGAAFIRTLAAPGVDPNPGSTKWRGSAAAIASRPLDVRHLYGINVLLEIKTVVLFQNTLRPHPAEAVRVASTMRSP
jgi:hypothetical protein